MRETCWFTPCLRWKLQDQAGAGGTETGVLCIHARGCRASEGDEVINVED